MPKKFRDDFFLPEWDHLCPRYLGVMFHPSGTICDQDVRCYLEATIIVERLFCQLLLFSPFSHLFAFVYIHFLFDLFFFASLSVVT